jgi:hypothetical protein
MVETAKGEDMKARMITLFVTLAALAAALAPIAEAGYGRP